MRIGVIGFESANSLPQRLCEEFAKMKVGTITQFSINNAIARVGPDLKGDYTYHKELLPMSRMIHKHEEQDFIFVEQSFVYQKIDVPVPIMYYHAELNSPFTIHIPKWYWKAKIPSWLALKLVEAEDILHMWAPQQYRRWRNRLPFLPAAHPPFYDPKLTDPNTPRQKKDILFSWIGPPDDTFIKTRRDYYWNRMGKPEESIVRYVTDRNICSMFSTTPVDVPTYLDVMRSSKFTLITSNEGVYMGRRVMEGALCFTVPVIWIENDNAERWIRDAGYDETNSIFFRTKPELRGIRLLLEAMPDAEYKMMADAAYKTTFEAHTFRHRAELIMDQVKNHTNVKKTKSKWIKYDVDIIKGEPEIYLRRE